MSYYSQVRVCSLSAGGSAGACVMAAPCDVSPSTGGPSHDGASLCATTSSGSPTASRRDAPTVSRGRPRWTMAAASRQPALHTPKVVACETCQRPVSVLAATMPARRAKHVTTPMPVGCQQEGGGVGGVEGWRKLFVWCMELGCGGGVASFNTAAATAPRCCGPLLQRARGQPHCLWAA